MLLHEEVGTPNCRDILVYHKTKIFKACRVMTKLLLPTHVNGIILEQFSKVTKRFCCNRLTEKKALETKNFPLMSGLDHLLMHIMQRDKAIIIIIIIIIIIAFWLLIQHINKLELN